MNLNQITIPSINLEKATIFYQKLGLGLIVDASPKYVRFECPEGHATFSIPLVDQLLHAQNREKSFRQVSKTNSIIQAVILILFPSKKPKK